MQKIRVLHVVHALNYGGLENGVVNLLNGLPQDLICQAVCCLEEKGELAQRVDGAIPTFELHRGRHDVGVWKRLEQVIREWRPHIIHCRNWTVWLDAYMGHLLAGRTTKLVWSFHGFADQGGIPLRRRIASRILAGLTDQLAAVCQDAADRFADHVWLSAARFHVLYNGVDTQRFKPHASNTELRRQLELPEDAVICTTVANFSPVKDHAKLLEAIAGVRPRLPQDTLFVWLGEGPERRHLESERARYDLQDKVLMPGKSDRVPEFLAASDIFILPSRLEGMSNAIVEAMAAGLPVIARAVGGNREVVVDGETGILTPPADNDALGRAIVELAVNTARRQTMGRASMQRVDKEFSLAAMMRNYASFYQSIVQGAQ